MSAYHHYLTFVVKDLFGVLVQQVVATLLTHGPLTLPVLIHYSALPPSQVRKALITCIQHNIVVADYEVRHPPNPSSSSPPTSALPTPRAATDPSAAPTPTSHEPSDVRVLYRVHEASLRCRPRYPAYVQKVRSRLGDDAALLVQSLAMKGILTTPQLLDHALTLYQQTHGLLPDASDTSSSVLDSSTAPASAAKRIELEAALSTLSSSRFIKRAIMAKAAAGKEGIGEGADEEKEFLSEAELKKRRREEEKNNRTHPSPRGADESKEDKRPQPRGRKKPPPSADDDEEKAQRMADSSRHQRQREEEEAERRRQQEASGIPDHWVLNDAPFTAEAQRDALLAYVRERVSPTSAFVMAALLRVHPYESLRAPVYEEGQVMEAVTALAKEASAPPRVTAAVLHSVLMEMTGDASHLLQLRGTTSFSIDFPAFLSHLQLLQTQSILTAHFSLLAARIYRVLLVHSRLEESQLAELCTASRQSVRETLHELMKNEWVCLYEVPRTVDRAPSKTFFLWGVDRAKVKERVRELMYVSAVKAMEREAKEKVEVADVMGKVDMQQRIGEKDKQRVERWRIGHERLEMAQKSIQDLLAVWQD